MERGGPRGLDEFLAPFDREVFVCPTASDGVIDLLDKFVHIVRFPDEMHPFIEYTVKDDDVRCVSGYEKDCVPWSNGLNGCEASKNNIDIISRS
ncbi:MAG: hypothetical protein H6Q41_4350 [Deltaproteobacteria bacterium]|nr:hypothetical protein [Deltaproteobacteria bacterium]